MPGGQIIGKQFPSFLLFLISIFLGLGLGLGYAPTCCTCIELTSKEMRARVKVVNMCTGWNCLTEDLKIIVLKIGMQWLSLFINVPEIVARSVPQGSS